MIEIKENIKDNKISLQKNFVTETSANEIIITNDIKELIETTKDIKNILIQLLNYEKEKNEITLIPRKDMKSLLNCSDITVAKMFNREDFPAIMIGEHKLEKTA